MAISFWWTDYCHVELFLFKIRRTPSSTLFPYNDALPILIIPMLCVTIFVILVVWFLLPRVARTIRPIRSEERLSRNAETDLVCRLLLEKKKAHTLVIRRPSTLGQKLFFHSTIQTATLLIV